MDLFNTLTKFLSAALNLDKSKKDNDSRGIFNLDISKKLFTDVMVQSKIYTNVKKSFTLVQTLNIKKPAVSINSQQAYYSTVRIQIQ